LRLFQLTIVSCFVATLNVANGATLEEEFRSPPNSARLWVYWTCQDGHYSLEGTTADLESMKKVGIGGVLRMDCDVGVPFGGIPYLSEKWRKQFVHAVHECERLGLEFTTITGPGWTGTGGPWIKADQSMQHLVPATVTTKGPAKFNQILPLPQPRISRYHRNQTPQMRKEINEFYKDVALFAFPRREPVIADIQEKALFIRNPFTSMQGVRPYLPSPASYPAATKAQAIDPKTIIDLTRRLKADGRLIWDVPPGEWTIVRLGVRSTGANTRPSPAAGLGLESDKFSKEALATHFEAFFDPLLKAIGPRPKDRNAGFVALDADSWEMSSQNWTPGFREEFKKRCGYDPWLYFATYTGCVVGSREQTERFLWDVRKVCQEILLENHAAELQKHCHQRGLRLMMEPYDMNPAGDIDLGSYADFPAGEFWFDTFQSGWSCITAASIAHTMGKPIVLAEGFTSGGGNWQRTPWVLKNQTDWAFAVGINKFAIHGFAHQSKEDSPGMTFGPYGVFWNRKQTFWPLVGDYHEYLARCSHLMQQGVAVSDILYLTPEGAPQVFQPPPSALHAAGSRLPDKKGYSFDGCSPRILMSRAEVKDGRITFPGGTSYRLLVLPRWKTMTPALLGKIIQLVEAGATVIGTRPVASPSLSDYPQCDAKVKGLAEKLWGNTNTPMRHVGKGKIFLDEVKVDANDLYPDYAITAALLEQMNIPQDFQSDGPLRYGHRRTGSEDIYFVANTTNNKVQATCTFRVLEGTPQLWNPVTTTIRPLPQFTHHDKTTSVPMIFEPHQSFFVIFSNDKPKPPVAHGVNFPATQPVATLEGPWEVSFDAKWGGPAKIAFKKLQDWTTREEPGIKYYSGIARYRRIFDLPQSVENGGQRSGKKFWLDVGTVHEMARVHLNGKDIGVVWCAPWRIDISDALKSGENQLEIEVANLWTNRLIGDASQPEHLRFTRTAIPARIDGTLKPSGLLGPVRILGQQP
jgi:hypothetical protein